MPIIGVDPTGAVPIAPGSKMSALPPSHRFIYRALRYRVRQPLRSSGAVAPASGSYVADYME